MITKTGTIIDKQNGLLSIQVDSAAGCKSCHCKKLFQSDKDSAQNIIQLKIDPSSTEQEYQLNDKVGLQLSELQLNIAVFWLFALPIASLLGASIVGQWFFMFDEAAVVLFSIMSFILSILVSQYFLRSKIQVKQPMVIQLKQPMVIQLKQ